MNAYAFVAAMLVVAVCLIGLGIRESCKEKPKPVEPVRPFVRKICEMLEKGDYTKSERDFGYCSASYSFALEENLQCSLLDYGPMTSVHSYWFRYRLYLDGILTELTAEEARLIATAFAATAEKARAKEEAEREAKRQAVMAKIEAYTVVDRVKQ